ncbi:MAG: outer membrane beta-barrel protein, partial [Hyphomicrobiales bacterium]|nr:outer membrane beta-barrel protein [Hyphomicrobiales bacterium]
MPVALAQTTNRGSEDERRTSVFDDLRGSASANNDDDGAAFDEADDLSNAPPSDGRNRPQQTANGVTSDGNTLPRPRRSGTADGDTTVDPSASTSTDPTTTGTATRRLPDPIEQDPAEEDPYAQLGLRGGSFIWFPAVEVRGGYTDNVTGTPGGVSGTYSEVKPELIARSNWSRHQLEINLSGTLRRYHSGLDATEPSFSGAVNGRIDLSEETTVDIGLGYDLTEEARSDPDVGATVSDPPLVHDYSGTVAINRNLGVVSLQAGASAARTVYDDSTLTDGTTTSNSLRDSTLYEGNLRLTLDTGAMIRPFAEGIVLRRIYDNPIDANGQRRDADGYELRGGVNVDITEIMTGEVAVGYRREILEDAGLVDLEGMTVSASLVWTPSELTTITIGASTDFNTTTTLGSPGSIQRGATVAVNHALRRNVDLDIGGGIQREEYVGTGRTDDTYSANAGITYKFNRLLSATGSYTYESVLSSV